MVDEVGDPVGVGGDGVVGEVVGALVDGVGEFGVGLGVPAVESSESVVVLDLFGGVVASLLEACEVFVTDCGTSGVGFSAEGFDLGAEFVPYRRAMLAWWAGLISRSLWSSSSRLDACGVSTVLAASWL